MKKTIRRKLLLLFTGLLAPASLVIYAPQAQAQSSFTPTEAEWATWPDYCRVRYVVSAVGRNSAFALRVAPEVVESYKKSLGEDVWHWLHHYCAGLAYIGRAKGAPDRLQRHRLLDDALGEMIGQYQRVPKTNVFFSITATSMARAYLEMDDFEKAFTYVREAMRAHPTYSPAYTLASLIYREEDDLQGARDVLLQGNAACGESSAEIHYFLGLTYLDLGEPDLAEEHARKAYSLGYPLPGLMSRLNRMGRLVD